MIARRVVLLAILPATAGLLVPPAPAEETDTARGVVARLYELHAGRADGSAIPLWEDPEERGRLFSPDLLAAFDADAAWRQAHPDDVPGLDGDPFYDAQDFDAVTVDLGQPEDAGADRATVTARFEVFAEPRLLSYRMVRTPGGWRIDDIAYAHPSGGYTLRDLLSGG